MKVIKFLILIVVLLIPLGELLRLDMGNNIFLKPLDIAVGITALFYIGIKIAKKKNIKENYLTKTVLAFSAISLVSLVINASRLEGTQIFTSFLYWARFVSYALLFFIIIEQNKNFKKNLESYLMLSGLLVLVLGYIQYFLYSNLRNLYYLGWDEHNHRLFSSFLDPNFAGAFLVLFSLFIVESARAEKKGKYKKFIYLFLWITTTIALFLTYSRSAILMLVFSYSTYLILNGWKKYLLPVFAAVAIIVISLSPTFNKENTNLLRTTSSFARIETYRNALQIIQDHPFMGVGFNTYRYAQEEYAFRPVNSRFPDHAEAGVDSSLLFVTATTGLIGLFAYLSIWSVVLKNSYTKHRKNNKYAKIVFASIIGLFVNSLFINSLFFPAIMLWMWIVIALINND